MDRAVPASRGTTNRNARGSAEDRRRRRAYLLAEFGDGITAPCALRLAADCLGVVTDGTISVDRIVPGILGGRYVRGNIRPACPPCNSLDGGLLGVARKSA